jgi:DNA-binding IscR family transcriptional regulator
MADDVRHFEGTIAMIYCVSEKSYQPCEFCKSEVDCKIRDKFKDICDYTFNVLKNTTLDELMPNQS